MRQALPATARSVPRLELDVSYASSAPWVPRPALLRRWAAAALPASPQPVMLSIRIVGKARSRSLNGRYRHQDKPTNVLSFAGAGCSPDGRLFLGELVICAPLVASEARTQHKVLEAHWAHLTIHGVLHLLGFDHVRRTQAAKMEFLETQVLDELGFSDPYR